METRYIFIDTCIFVTQNYNYRSDVFKNIIRLSKSGQAKVVITDITIREIEARIDADISKAIQAYKTFVTLQPSSTRYFGNGGRRPD